MHCESCGFDNAEDARFCGNCGTALDSPCANCGRRNPPGFRFCSNCGNRLVGAPGAAVGAAVARAEPTLPAALTAPAPAPAGGPERRWLSVLFCDLVGSTALAGQLDPEDLRELMHAYERRCTEILSRFDGYVAQFYGDGVLAYFGYPRAHEDEAQRAIRAGLALVAEVPLLREDLDLKVRVGVHSGLVVVGVEAGGDPWRLNTAVGDAPNIAARVEAEAEPGALAVSETTWRSARGFFLGDDLGERRLKGLSEPLRLYRVRAEKAASSRIEAAERGVTPLIGRERELGLLIDLWQKSRLGSGGAVLLSGEPGIGKTRIIQTLRDHAQGQPHRWLRHYCSPYHSITPFHPLVDSIERGLEFSAEMDASAKLDRMEEMLRAFGQPLAENAALFARLLNLPSSGRYPTLDLGPAEVKERMLKALLALVSGMANRQPVLFVLEDVQWADPSTLEYVTMLVEQAPSLPLLMLITFRPEFQPPWGARSHIMSLPLTRLRRDQAAALATAAVGGKTLPKEVLDPIIDRADGVPMFVEELARMVMLLDVLKAEDGRYRLVGSLPPLAIPDTLQDSLMARLDRLGWVKEVAQLGATIGRSFGFDLLRAVSPLHDDQLRQALATLVDSELVLQRGLPPNATYVFRHALIQEVAYESLLKSKRRRFHQEIAETLVTQFAAVVEDEPENVARHFARAGMDERALDFCCRAGTRDLHSSAVKEAERHVAEGYKLLETLPPSRKRTERELELRTTEIGAMMISKGYTAPELGAALRQAQELAKELGDVTAEAKILLGLFSHYLTLGRADLSQEISHELEGLAEKIDDPAVKVPAYQSVAGVRADLGDMIGARQALEAALSFGPVKSGPNVAPFEVHDLFVIGQSIYARTLWALGYPDQARRSAAKTEDHALRQSHPFTLAFALGVNNALLMCARDWQTLKTKAEEIRQLAVKNGYATWLVNGTVFGGVAQVMTGAVEHGLAEIDKGLEMARPIWTNGPPIFFAVALAHAYIAAGALDQADAVITKALEQMPTRGGRSYESELIRLRAMITLARTPQRASTIEADLRQALEIARAQKTKAWELRAATSLAAWLRQQGRADEAREILAPVLAWFEEGFDEPDYRDARAVLGTIENPARERSLTPTRA